MLCVGMHMREGKTKLLVAMPVQRPDSLVPMLCVGTHTGEADTKLLSFGNAGAVA